MIHINKNTINETFNKHLNYLKRRVRFLSEGLDNNEEKALLNLKQLASKNSDDFYDAMREFESIYGYKPNVNVSGDIKFKSRSNLEGRTLYFYKVPVGKEIRANLAGLKKTKSGRWYGLSPSIFAEKEFGKPSIWTVK
jgi:hypothetical protein